jgi:hypothetical protein
VAVYIEGYETPGFTVMVYSEDMPEYTTSTTIPVDAYIHTSDKPVLYLFVNHTSKQDMVRHPASADDIVLSSTSRSMVVQCGAATT